MAQFRNGCIAPNSVALHIYIRYRKGMGLSCGIVGLPNVGKSTIFNALTRTGERAGAEVQNYPFCTIDPNVGIVPVPDPRLQRIAEIIKPQAILPTVLEVVDIAGLVKGASQGEGLGNKFLNHIRQVQAIIHVVRCFEDSNIIHVDGKIDPLRDMDVIHMELALADLDSVEKRIAKNEKLLKSGDKNAKEEIAFLTLVREKLNTGESLLQLSMSEDQRILLTKELSLMSAKPVLYVANVSESQLLKTSEAIQKIEAAAKSRGGNMVQICGKIEDELASLAFEERQDFLRELGIAEPGLHQLIRFGYTLLELITFFTAGEKEVRAWTLKKGLKAPQAAGVIHSDFERGFIRAETYHYDDLIKYKSEAAVRAQGLMRLEGKDYIVKDGDIMHFRFNV